MPTQIAICDDDRATVEMIQSLVADWASIRKLQVHIDAFPSAEAFLFHYADRKDYDILLLDVEMKSMNGIELAKTIRIENDKVQIVFITGFPDFMAEGYEVAALHYLIKPVKNEKLYEVLDRAMGAIRANPRYLVLPSGKETVRIIADDILYVESDGHYVLLHTVKETHRLRLTIPQAEILLGDGFFRCGRSFVVGLKFVSRITKTSVFLENGTELPLSRGLYDSMNLSLIRYLRGI